MVAMLAYENWHRRKWRRGRRINMASKKHQRQWHLAKNIIRQHRGSIGGNIENGVKAWRHPEKYRK
jgi:hypothetical protein